jgi:peptidoglycan/LPS O-acetylase OafA/YrhL
MPHALYPRLVLLIAMQLCMLPNMRVWHDILLFPVLNPGWSLFFEMLANIGFGALIRLRRGATPYITAIYAIALTAMLYWAHVHHEVDIGWSSSLKSFCGGIARVSLSFMAGVLVLRLHRAKAHHTLTPAFSAILALVIATALLVMLLTPFAVMQSYHYQLLAIAFGFPCLVLLGSFCRVPKAWNPVCAFLGDVSYPLYLFHYSFIGLFMLPGVEAYFALHHALAPYAIPANIALTCACAYLAQIVYDIPIRSFLTRALAASTPSHPARPINSAAAPPHAASSILTREP